MLDGTHTDDDINTLACSAMVAKALNPARDDLCAQAMATLDADNPDIDLLRKLLNQHDVDRRAATHRQYGAAIRAGIG